MDEVNKRLLDPTTIFAAFRWEIGRPGNEERKLSSTCHGKISYFSGVGGTTETRVFTWR
jgi:hypothetical protein